MNTPGGSNSDDREKEKPIQFRLATLLVAITLFCLYCGLVKWRNPISLLILFFGGSIGGIWAVRRFGEKDVFTSAVGGAFGAGLLMGVTGFLLGVSLPDPQYTIMFRLNSAWYVLHFSAIVGAICGGIVGFLYALVARVVGGKKQIHNDDSSAPDEDRRP